MSDVTRYSLTATHDADENGVEMGNFPDGEWVKFEDYQSLVLRLDEAVKMRELAEKAMHAVQRSLTEETKQLHLQADEYRAVIRAAAAVVEAVNGSDGAVQRGDHVKDLEWEAKLRARARALQPFVVEIGVSGTPRCNGTHGPPDCNDPHCWRGPIANA